MNNAQYIREIDRLIPIAQRAARERVVEFGKLTEDRPGYKIVGGEVRDYQHCFFTEFFHEEMNIMAYEAGLRPMIGVRR